ncbi:MAG TPA: gliding motility-associated C-terminal domain-containing protein [Chitinophagaceae bacterium]|nr:gliding motility-associated C-terminal domain-containing protein [Chitinophagaceae bacterium]
MKKARPVRSVLLHFIFTCFLLFGIKTLNALQVRIIESQSYLSTDIMDLQWKNVVQNMGHTAVISPQSTLDNTTFFSTTDILIVSSGSINLPANRVNTILLFLQTGKPVYLQGEYNCGLSTNQAFSYFVNTMGGTFSWGSTTPSNTLQMQVLGSMATTPNAVPVLPYFNFGCYGTGCGIQYFLEDSARFYGYFYCPPNPSLGRIIQTTDQDWINNATSFPLMENIFTHLVSPSLCSGTSFTPLNLGSDTTLCIGQSLTLNATNSNATYLWQNGSVDPTLTVTSSGTYWVQVSNTCGVFSDTITVQFAPAPMVDLGKDTMICAGQIYTLHATTPGASYTWQNGSHDSVFACQFSGIYSVMVNLGGCVAKDTVIVNFYPSPVVFLGNDTTLCSGDSLILNATTFMATSYQWQDMSVQPTFTVKSPGFYSVTVNTPCGLINDLILIDYKASPVVHLGNDTTLCTGQSILLNASTPNATYLWPDNSQLPTYLVSEPGLYTVEVFADGCTGRDSIDIQYKPTPQISMGGDKVLCQGEQLTFDFSTPGAHYLWQDLSTESVYTITKEGTYWVSVELNGCTGSDSIDVDYLDHSCNCNVFIPNAFSPNHDGLNEEFRFLCSPENIELKDFVVMNRWGNPVFVAQNINDSWNGRYLGSDAEAGTYYYLLRYTCTLTGKSYQLQGDVLLIR